MPSEKHGQNIHKKSQHDAIRRKARILRERNPRVFSVQALADIFGKPKATMHYMLTN